MPEMDGFELVERILGRQLDQRIYSDADLRRTPTGIWRAAGTWASRRFSPNLSGARNCGRIVNAITGQGGDSRAQDLLRARGQNRDVNLGQLRARILLAEDNAVNQRVAARFWKKQGTRWWWPKRRERCEDVGERALST